MGISVLIASRVDPQVKLMDERRTSFRDNGMHIEPVIQWRVAAATGAEEAILAIYRLTPNFSRFL